MSLDPALLPADVLAFLSERHLATLTTIRPDGTPHVVPVGWSFNAELDAVEIRGHDFARSKKFRDVLARPRAAVVIDDIASVDPWRVRGVEIRGRAEAIAEPRALIRVYPERIVSWGIDGDGRVARTATAADALTARSSATGS